MIKNICAAFMVVIIAISFGLSFFEIDAGQAFDETAVPFSGGEGVTVGVTQQEITIDGKLIEEAWEEAPIYVLTLLDSGRKLPPLTREVLARDKYESGGVRFLLGEKYLYIGLEFKDTDIVAQVNKDQQPLFNSGDVAEVFVKADGFSGYWEFYVSPLGNKTSYFFPSPGHLGLPKCFNGPIMKDMEVAAIADGVVNNYTQLDQGWTAEMAIPLAELEESTGTKFNSGGNWRILVARYNYGYSLRSKQLSSFPELPQINYHLLEYYAPIISK